jgi:hypothetical protein
MEAGRQVRKEAGIERIRYPSAGCQILRIRTGFVAFPCGGKLQQQQYPGDADEDFRNAPRLTSFVPALLFRVGSRGQRRHFTAGESGLRKSWSVCR